MDKASTSKCSQSSTSKSNGLSQSTICTPKQTHDTRKLGGGQDAQLTTPKQRPQQQRKLSQPKLSQPNTLRTLSPIPSRQYLKRWESNHFQTPNRLQPLRDTPNHRRNCLQHCLGADKMRSVRYNTATAQAISTQPLAQPLTNT